MAVDMKAIIARETRNLLFDQKVKKLTVKSIVDACHITRQAFYYHFADIPELLKWMLEQGGNELFLRYGDSTDVEEQLRRFFTTAVNARPVLKKGLAAKYGSEMESLLMENMQSLLHRVVEKRGALQSCTPIEREIVIRYHCQAAMGMLRHWTEEDTENMDHIVHAVYLTLSNGLDL